MTVRHALPADAEALWRLNREFNGDTGVTPEMIARALRENAGEIVLLAEDDGKAVGFACARVSASMCYPDKMGELTEMYVCPNARRRGAGEALVRAAVAAMRSAGAEEITVLTGETNAPAQALYEKCGFRPSGERHFEIS